MPKFTVRLGDKVLRVQDVEEDLIIIGRHEKAEIRLDNAAISRKHARVYFADGGYVLEDLGSVNGVFLNGRRIKAHFLANGDEIQIGKFAIKFEQGAPRSARGRAVLMPELPQGQRAPDLGEPTMYVKPQPKPVGEAPAGPQLRVPHLRSIGPGANERFPLNKTPVIFGKSDGADIPLKGLLLGSHVAEVANVAGAWWVRGTSKMAGLKVNGVPVREQRLNHDDLIQIGDNLFTFKLE